MQCTFLAILRLTLFNSLEIGAVIIPALQPRELTLSRLGYFLQITQLVRNRVGFGILISETTVWPQGLIPMS